MCNEGYTGDGVECGGGSTKMIMIDRVQSCLLIAMARPFFDFASNDCRWNSMRTKQSEERCSLWCAFAFFPTPSPLITAEPSPFAPKLRSFSRF